MGGGVGTLLDVRQGEQLVYTAAESIPRSNVGSSKPKIKSIFYWAKVLGPLPEATFLLRSRHLQKFHPGSHQRS